ncbi:alkaline phosphatase [Caulobacter sp. S45]|uniref:alkaline phosphatase D family protein n=1 Tax=Caulobacter sp. S45 TaxID=1641861 RepID=UPI00131EA1BA|nr:alkaline phosphatase D family protein [Caulobacter sp. S45]
MSGTGFQRGGASRRGVLAGMAAGLAAPAIVRAQTLFVDTPFQLGVASGDPSPDGFVIWTRLAPRPLEQHGGMPMAPVEVDYEVAADERFKTVVAKGSTLARPELGHSVHVEIAGLQPHRPYWYRFHIGRERSLTGRARTLPAPGSALERVRFVAGGCQNYEQGLYTAYRHVAEEDLDFFWHYGDYIYEERATPTATDHASGLPIPPIRVHVGDEPYSLDDYRLRYAQYKLDTDLQAAHAAHSWWVTWDDHEIDNNWASQWDQDGTPPEIFNLRRQAAAQAYYENMPLRKTSFPHGTAIQIFRRAAYGDLLNAHFLDTRQFRMDQPCGDNFKPVCPEALASDRTIMGAEEERWLFDGLAKSPTRWNLIANQVMMMPLDRRYADQHEAIWNMDSWAGYPAARKRLLDHIEAHDIKNVVVATGDEHQNYAGELRSGGRPDGKTLAVEFVATSISSGGDGSDLRKGSDVILANNPHLKFVNDQRGYAVCDVGRDVWKTDFRVVDAVSRPSAKIATRASFAVERGAPGLKPA